MELLFCLSKVIFELEIRELDSTRYKSSHSWIEREESLLQFLDIVLLKEYFLRHSFDDLLEEEEYLFLQTLLDLFVALAFLTHLSHILYNIAEISVLNHLFDFSIKSSLLKFQITLKLCCLITQFAIQVALI